MKWWNYREEPMCMDKEKLTIGQCIEMLEKEKMHVIIHAGRVTDIIKPCNNGTQGNTGFHCVPSE